MSIRPDLAAVVMAASLLAAPALGAGGASGGRCGRDYVTAKAGRATADMAAKRGDQRGANIRLDEALRTLGTRYRSREMIDDSDMHLLLARQAIAKGRLRQAVAIKRRILSDRLQLCLMGPTTG